MGEFVHVFRFVFVFSTPHLFCGACLLFHLENISSIASPLSTVKSNFARLRSGGHTRLKIRVFDRS